MKQIILLATMVLLLGTKIFAQKCGEQLTNDLALSAGDNTVFMRDFQAKLKAGTIAEPMPVAIFNDVLLNKGVHYRFSVGSDTITYKSKPILKVYNADGKLLQSTFDEVSKKHFAAFDLICRKTEQFKVYISFENGEEGCAVGILSMIR